MKNSIKIEYECLSEYHGPKLCSYQQSLTCSRCPMARPLNSPSEASDSKATPAPPKD